MDRLVARRVLVTGEVQGVFYRASCARRAREAGVAGWIRNRADGRVEALFEGRPESVDNLVTWCDKARRRRRCPG